MTAGLVDRDVRSIEVPVTLPDGGHTRHVMRVAGPASYLATKVDALRKRNKNKDAYDIVWLVESWLGGQAAFARAIADSAIAMGPTLQALREEFADIDAAGAVKYGNFMARDAAEVDRASRHAVGAVAALISELARLEGVR